jgi:hypothetical protein
MPGFVRCVDPPKTWRGIGRPAIGPRTALGLWSKEVSRELLARTSENSPVKLTERKLACIDSGAHSNSAGPANGAGLVEGVTHDYVRHGTTTLFAALGVSRLFVRGS